MSARGLLLVSIALGVLTTGESNACPYQERQCLPPVKYLADAPGTGCWCYLCEADTPDEWTQCTRERKVKSNLDAAVQGAKPPGASSEPGSID
jgi:hypothetical protein